MDTRSRQAISCLRLTDILEVLLPSQHHINSLPIMKTRPFIFTFLAIILSSLNSYSKGGITAEKIGNRIDVTVNNRFFTSYLFHENEKYPFLFPVNGPLTGSSVTSLRNGEYPHHSSLFFGCDKVNGGNYWQEGLDRGRIVSAGAVIAKQDSQHVVITDECTWMRPGAPSPVRDYRKITISAPSPALYIIDFEIRLVALMDVTIEKTNHSLFSVRMDADLSVRNGGTMINAEGQSGEKATFGKQSPWIDFHGQRGKVKEGLALLQHPSNPDYPSPWFTRDYGFISPTPLYWPASGNSTFFPKGESVTLRYRVLVHGGDTTEAGIAGEWEKYRAIP